MKQLDMPTLFHEVAIRSSFRQWSETAGRFAVGAEN